PVGTSVDSGFCIHAGQNPDGRPFFPYSRTLLQHVAEQGGFAAKLSLIVVRPWWRGGDIEREIAAAPIAGTQNGDRFCVWAGEDLHVKTSIRGYSTESVLKVRGEVVAVPYQEAAGYQDRTRSGGALIYQGQPGRGDRQIK
ncbi:MAG: hypothetical protein ACM3Y9_14015, partial [Ignavibacteria bacterium]